MSVMAGGYVLKVPRGRRGVLLEAKAEDESHFRTTPLIAEPVPNFRHSRRAPLVVFASFQNEKITHVAEGKRGVSAGTGLMRLNMTDLKALNRAITFDQLRRGIPRRLHASLDRILRDGGILPPKTFSAFLEQVMELDLSLRTRLARYSRHRREVLTRIAPRAQRNLAIQKETVGIALEIAGISRDKLLDWQPDPGGHGSFLDGLRGTVVREDTMLLADFATMPGFEAVGDVTHYGTNVFESNGVRGNIRLTIIMANRLPLEQQTGADLIYFNETYKSFVMVQYKAMENRDGRTEFRWQSDDQFMQEIARMDNMLGELSGVSSSNAPDGYRLSDNPFFFKFCPRVNFNPDDKGLFKGIYLPLDLWKRAVATGKLRGPMGGNVLTFENVGRHINNQDFVILVANSWVGTTIEQSTLLQKLIREVLESGKTVTFAIKHAIPIIHGLDSAASLDSEKDGDGYAATDFS